MMWQGAHEIKRVDIATCGLVSLLSLTLTQCTTSDSSPPSLLADQTPSRAVGVSTAESLTDGKALRDGRSWEYSPSAHFRSERSMVEYDLGEPRSIRAAWMHADHNDVYELEISNDGASYEVLWRIPTVKERGLRARFNGELDAVGRYLRLLPKRGDGKYAVSELQVFSEPLAAPPTVTRIAGYVPQRTFRSQTLLFGFALVAWLLLAVARARWWWVLLVAAWPAVAGYQLIEALIVQWPVWGREVSLVRGVVAVVAAIAIGWEAFSPKSLQPRRAVVLSVLGVCAMTAFFAFYNLGYAQFYNQKDEARTFAHHLDLRQYYTTAKYFPEVGYGGIYAADMAAYLEDVPGATFQDLATTPIRDLQTLDLVTVADEKATIEAAPGWFSPERWAEYKRDTGFFREAMGHEGYLDTLRDMGGNATPLWLSVAHLIFNSIEPSDRAFTWTGMLDPLLLLGAFLTIAYAFGVRTMLVCMVIFGANDFVMYGTNWGGATLRHDWMAYLAFGACAIKRERFALGGALFAASAMIRAFPALALVGTTLPAAWWVVEYRAREGRFPSAKLLRTERSDLLRIVIGAALGLVVLLAFSVAVLPADAWRTWISKVGELSIGAHANHVSLRLLFGGWESQYRTLLERLPAYLGAIVVMVVLVIAGARRATLVQGAILALMLIPVIFYPANYYIHFVWLLPLLAAEQRNTPTPVGPAEALIWIALLAMCGAQYFTVLAPDFGLHFWLASVILFTTLLLVLLIWVSRDRINALSSAKPPKPA